MEVYILDRFYRRDDVVDDFESFIWTERFSAHGDFELDIESTLKNRTRFKEGTHLVINESYRVMIVETVEDSIDDEGRKLLKIKGRSFESILLDRLAWGAMTDLTAQPKWVLTGTPVEIATQMFNDVCIVGLVGGDYIPNMSIGSIFPEDTIEPPPEEITYEIDPKPLYTALKDLCDIYSLGFRMVRNLETTLLYFDVYTGSDRTTRQTTLPAVVFSQELDNLQNSTELSSAAGYKNVAYVLTPVGTRVVYAPEVQGTIVGFERRALTVVANDIKDTDPLVAQEKMLRRGEEELAKHRRVHIFDGEISQNSEYVYGVDYNLGDLVQVRRNDGITTDMRVTEQIFVSDNNGDRSYPTLSVDQLIEPGAWLNVPAEQVWEDLGPTDYWADRP